MKIVKIDLDKYSNVKQICKLDDEYILFIQITNNNLNVYKQNINTNKASKINQKSIECNENIYPQIKVNDQSILIEVESIDSETKGIYKIDLITKEEKLYYKTKKQGNIILLNKRYALLLCQDDFDEEEFDIEKDMNGEYNHAYLIDIDTNEEYEIHDNKVKKGIRYELPIYSKNNDTYLIIEEVHMEDYEAEDIYHSTKNTRNFEQVDTQSINVIKLEEFIKNVKENRGNINYNIICENSNNICINYFGQKEDYFFYRAKNFDSNEETIYRVNKDNFEIDVACNFNLKQKYRENNSCIFYDKYNQIVFIETRELKKIETAKTEGIPLHEVLDISKEELCENYDFVLLDEYETVSKEITIPHKDITIKAIHNSEIPDTIIDNNLITNYWTEIENDDEYQFVDYVRLINLSNSKEQIFKNSYVRIDDMIILY